MFCIPQEPFLFSGSMRENLDPLGEFREHEIWEALNKVNLGETIKRLGGLDHSVMGGGVNFSMGQKQLICLARAVLHNAKVMFINYLCYLKVFVTLLTHRFYVSMKPLRMLIKRQTDKFNKH